MLSLGHGLSGLLVVVVVVGGAVDFVAAWGLIAETMLHDSEVKTSQNESGDLRPCFPTPGGAQAVPLSQEGADYDLTLFSII